MTEKEILKMVSEDGWMMDILRVVRDLNLPDWWIGAGFVRGKVWDVLHGYTKRTPLPDIDVIYFDRNDFSKDEALQGSTSAESKLQNHLKDIRPNVNWSVTNQARMHIIHNDKSYTSSAEALSRWVETATCVGIRLDDNGKLSLVAPHGIDDLVNLVVRPTPAGNSNMQLFRKRLEKKQWLSKWPKLKVIED